MKRKWLLPIALLVVSVLVFTAYSIYDRYITDNVAPKITVEETGEVLQLSIREPKSALLQGVSAWDARDGDVTASVIIEGVTNIGANHQATVTYAAFDSAGNVAKTQRTVWYTDYEGPRFTLSQPLLFTYGGRVDTLDHIGAQDYLDGDISHRVKVTMLDEASITSEGVHNVMFRVTNSLSDTAELVIPVEVYAADKYTAQLTLTEYIVYLQPGESFEEKDYLENFRLYSESTSLSAGVPDELTLKVSGQVNTDEPGTYPVSYTVSTVRNGLTYSGYSKLIVVVEG